jgi:hypothetical protein
VALEGGGSAEVERHDTATARVDDEGGPASGQDDGASRVAESVVEGDPVIEPAPEAAHSLDVDTQGAGRPDG